ncbi:A24 family peptidase [Marinobacter arenosus]|uniref:A24 family peptidase n=1 Tax=Marinobacter arenosus TaxID=2856822 RepID=UPI001C4BFAD5|nr:prepilin peptidase [Marinobacter arenosus]MBW0146112.1 prepilin peptidase [Marinobacter arenosus]
MTDTNWMLPVLAVALVIAVVTDLTAHRIPNWLTLSLVVVGLAGQAVVGHWQGLLVGLGGGLVGLLCFLPLHIFGAMGAGDVKLMTAVGVLLGPQTAFVSVLATIAFGGGIALVFIGLRGGLGAFCRRYGRMAVMLASRKPVYLAPAVGEAAAERFPYALAIACGSFFSIWYLA